MRIICFLSFWLLGVAAQGQQAVSAVLDSAEYFVDQDGQFSLQDLPSQHWKSLPNDKHINIGYNVNASVWCRFTFTNTSAQNQRFGLTFYNNNLDSLVCYETNRIRILGDRTANEAQFLSYHSFVFELKPHEAKLCTVKLKKMTSFFEFSYGIETEANLVELSKVKLIVISVFIGVILILVLLNLSMYSINQKPVYFYYSLYSLCSILYIVSYSNFAKFTLFPTFLYFSEVHIYASTMGFIFLSLLVLHYTHIKQHQPKKYNWLLINLRLSLVLILVSFLFYLLQWDLLLKICFYLVFSYITINFFYLIFLLIRNTRYERKLSYLMLLTFWPHLFWGHAIFLRSFKVIEASFPENVLVFVFLYEALVFGYILTTNYLSTHKENAALAIDLLSERDKTIHVISQTQLRERRNIANLIHDNIGSQLAYIRQLIQLKQYAQVNDSMSNLSDDIRMISHQILPKSLDDGALVASLSDQINSRSRNLALPTIELYNYEFPELVKEEWVFDVYLMVLELINNGIKHGNAQLILLEFYGYSTHYLIQITDDGTGFDTASVEFGFGLDNIQKRISNYKGSFEITSTLNQGTVVQINLPIKY